MNTAKLLMQLSKTIDKNRDYAVCVSGGVDSVTTVVALKSILPSDRLLAVHAFGPSVPSKDTLDTQTICNKNNIQLKMVSSSDLVGESYLSNPINRCYFCKFGLFNEIQALYPDHILVTGTNLSDKSDFRPGLKAAREYNVFEPLAKLKLCKNEVRVLAKELGLDYFSTKPSSPCLASRIETGIKIDEKVLMKIDEIETQIKSKYNIHTVRLRLRKQGYFLEIVPEEFSSGSEHVITEIENFLKIQITDMKFCGISKYKMGSAFLNV